MKVLCLKDLDDDSEAEKLSPLLVDGEGSTDMNLRMNSIEDSVVDPDDVRIECGP